MSARQRFVANGKQGSSAVEETEKSTPAPNSNETANGEDNTNSAKAPVAFNGIDKPLNMARLKAKVIRPTSVITAQQQQQHKKPRLDRVKESAALDGSGTISRVQSPRPPALALSPRPWENINVVPQSPFAHHPNTATAIASATLVPTRPNGTHIPRLPTPGPRARQLRTNMDTDFSDATVFANDHELSRGSEHPALPGFMSPTSSPQEPAPDSAATVVDLYDMDMKTDVTCGLAHPLRRTSKRIGGYQDADVVEIEGPAKRQRVNENDMLSLEMNANHGTHPNRLPGQRQVSPIQPLAHTEAQRYVSPAHNYGLSAAPPQTHQPPDPPAYTQHEHEHPRQQRTLPAHEQALYKLGIDLSECMSVNAAKYEADRRRWAECSLDEWREGSKELNEEFEEIVTMVKEHMTSKLALFANLDQRVNEHRNTLGEREQQLKELRNKLVNDSGSVLDGANN